MRTYPRLQDTVLDGTDVRALAEFWRRYLGLTYRDGDEPTEGKDPDWLVLVDDAGQRKLAFQQVDALPRSTWPSPEVPQQLHLDLTVGDTDELGRQRARAQELGAVMLLDRSADPEEPLYVFADPAGHPFCVFVA